MLNRISSGWLWLDRALNAIIDEVNRQKPVPSTTIAVEESPSGTLLKLTSLQQAATGGGGGEVWDPSVGWQAMTVIDNSSGVCVSKYIYYWGTAPAASPGPPPAMPTSG
jgi:hypothetical protein